MQICKEIKNIFMYTNIIVKAFIKGININCIIKLKAILFLDYYICFLYK